MIFYFSGTGNSKWIAQQLAGLTNDKVMNIASFTNGGAIPNFSGKDEAVGLVFPIYAWAPPRIVMEFIQKLDVHPNRYAYAVCTCGDDAGSAIKKIEHHLPLQAAWSIIMPNNYIPMYEVDGSQLAAAKVAAARIKLPEIANVINSRGTAREIHTGSMAGLKTWVVNPVFNAFAMSTRPFSVASACNGCGLCEQNCPCGVIELANGKPIWVKSRCYQCLACINRCPKRAIQYGAGTKKRGRYFFTEEESGKLGGGAE